MPYFTILLSCLNYVIISVVCIAKGSNALDPIEQLVHSSFPIMDQYLPSRKDLKLKKLLRRLGNEFDSEWMSVKKPPIRNAMFDTKNNVDSIGNTENAEYIRTLEAQLELNNKTKQQIISAMKSMTICKTKFTWKRMGALFWPKYIKEGICVEKKQCSFKSDMGCKMGKERTLNILHWRCRKRKIAENTRTGKKKAKQNQNKRLVENTKQTLRANLKCRWKKIRYNVKTRCECKCG